MTVIEAVLGKADICHIAMTRENQPYVVPVNFAYRDYVLYFHSALEGKKMRILRENGNVCFSAETGMEILQSENPCNWGARYYSVIGFGTAYIIESAEEKKKALDIIMDKYSGKGNYNYSHASLENMAVIRIDISDLSGKVSGYSDHSPLLKSRHKA